MSFPALIGEVDSRDSELEDLRDQIRLLKEELRSSRAETSAAKIEGSRAVRKLRQVLTPLYSGLKELFGEMEAIGYEESGDAAPTASNQKAKAVWESWIQKLGGKRADFIRALLDHGEMTSAQLKVATHSGTSTVPQIIHQLKELGLINKNGGRFSLKDL